MPRLGGPEGGRWPLTGPLPGRGRLGALRPAFTPRLGGPEGGRSPLTGPLPGRGRLGVLWPEPPPPVKGEGIP